MFDPRAFGARCRDCILCGQQPVAPVQSALQAQSFVLLNEFPSNRDSAQRTHLSGQSARMVDAALKRAGMDWNDVHVTSVVLCTPVDNDLDAAVKEVKKTNKLRQKLHKQAVKAAADSAKKQSKAQKKWDRDLVRVRAHNAKQAEQHERQTRKYVTALEKHEARTARERARIEKVGGVYEPSGEGPPTPPEAPVFLPEPEPLTFVDMGAVAPPAPLELLDTPQQCCQPRLERELAGAKTVLMLGRHAMEAVLQRDVAMMDEQGFPVKIGPDLTGVGVPHPSSLYGAMEKYRGAFMVWVERAVRLWRDQMVWVKDPSPYYTASRVRLVLKELLRLADEACKRGASPIHAAFDVETDGLDTSACQLRCCGIAMGDVTAVVVSHKIDGTFVEDSAVMSLLQQCLQHSHIFKWFHNGMYDIPVIERTIGPVAAPIGDTLLVHHSIESEVPHSLSFVSSVVLDASSWKSLGDGTHGLSVQDDRQLWLYNSVDVSRTVKLVQPLLRMATDDGVTHVAETANKLLPILARMGGRGLRVDEVKRAEVKARLLRENQRCVQAMLDILTPLDPLLVQDFSYTRPAHRDCAWELLGIAPHLERTESGTYKSTADDLMRAMPHISAEARAFIGCKFGPGNPGAGFLGAQSTQKAVSTFCEIAPSPDGRLRSSWRMHGTPTGRLSSVEPNLQNIPEWLRVMYVPRDGYVFVAADYSALELWIVAIYTQAVNLLEALKSADVHRTNTEALFNLAFVDRLAEAATTGCAQHRKMAVYPQPVLTDVEDAEGHVYTHHNYGAFTLIDAGKKFKCDWRVECPDCVAHARTEFDLTVEKLNKLRGQAKRYVYGANYGGGPATIWAKLVVEFPALRLEDVVYLSQQWNRVNPQIQAKAHANEQLYYRRRLQHGVGWLESPVLGRRRYWTGKEFGPTDAANYPIQSAAADIVNLALLALNDDAEALGAELVAQVHDCLVYEVPEKHAMAVKHLLETKMPGPYKFLGIDGEWRFPVEAKIGKNWSEV